MARPAPYARRYAPLRYAAWGPGRGRLVSISLFLVLFAAGIFARGVAAGVHARDVDARGELRIFARGDGLLEVLGGHFSGFVRERFAGEVFERRACAARFVAREH